MDEHGEGRQHPYRGRVAEEREFARAYLGMDGRPINWVLIQTVMASVADTVVIPMQDVLGLGNEARMNMPGRAEGNWGWRFLKQAVSDGVRDRLAEYATLYER